MRCDAGCVAVAMGAWSAATTRAVRRERVVGRRAAAHARGVTLPLAQLFPSVFL